MTLSKRTRYIFRGIFVLALLFLLIPLFLEHVCGLYLLLPETARMVLTLVDEVIIVVSLLLGFRLSEFRWLRITAACLLGILVVVSVFLTIPTRQKVVTVVDDSGPRTLVIQQNSWALGTDNRLFVQVNPLFVRSLNKNLITTTSATPFSNGDYTLEWTDDTVTIHYKEGTSENSVWSTAVVQLP